MRAILTTFLLLAAGTAAANPCAYRNERDFSVDTAGIKALAFELASSDIHVRGDASLKTIQVHTRACASDESKLAGLTVEQKKDGDRVVLIPHQEDSQTFSLFGSHYAFIDLEVLVPAALAIEVKSRSGDADIADVASLDFSSHSGDLVLHRVKGDVAVDVHSGDVTADDVGNFTVRHSGSGDIHAQGVSGDVKVGHVGSGDLVFADVKRGVSVESVGSGDIDVSHAGGDVTVGSIGSGDVTVASVGGDFRVNSSGSGDIHHRDVRGKVQVPRSDED
jgi:DUF4097 and DUF4098 domain-containing protein YvlB